jgi:hypothetical protein
MLSGYLKSVIDAVVIGVGIGITLGVSVIGAATTLKVAGFVVTPPHAVTAVTIELTLKPANQVKP